MKKLLFSALFAACSTVAMAQQLIPEIRNSSPYFPKQEKTVNSRALSKSEDSAIHVRYSFIDSARNFTTFRGYSNTFLFPDSTVKQIYGSPNGVELGAVNIHSIGQIFDINSNFFFDHTPAINGYRLDSVSIAYSYIQNIKGLADTLIFQYYTNDTDGGIITGSLPDGEKTAWINADVNKSIGKGAVKQYIYLINQKDTTGSFKILTVPVPEGLNVAPQKISGFTVTFKPGYSYNTGDTLDSRWDNPVPRKKLNNFRILTQNDNEKVQDKSYTHGVSIVKSIKYNQNPGAWENKYIPGDAWGTYYQHLHSAFFIAYCPNNNCTLPESPSNDTIGGTPTFTNIEELKLQNGYKLGNIYPNPAERNAVLTFTLPKTENVNIKIYNTIGQLVNNVANGTYTSGNYQLNIDCEHMKPGIYFFTINAGNFTETRKFSIVK